MSTSQNKQLSDKNPDGTTMGQSVTDYISFYGATPIVQPTVGTGTTAPATTVAVSTSAWGFASSTQANQVIAAVTALYNLGLIS